MGKVKTQTELEHFIEILKNLAKQYDKNISSDLSKILSTAKTEGIQGYLLLGKAAGFELKHTPYSLKEIIEPLLPCILLLEGKTTILYEIDRKKDRYLVRGEEGVQEWLSGEALGGLYSGEMFLVKPHASSISRQQYMPTGKHWFWDSLLFSASLYTDIFIATFLLNIFALMTPLFVRNVYDRVVPNAAFDTLFMLSGGILIIYLFDVFFRFLRTYLLELAGKKSDIIISSKIFEHILNIKLSHKFKSVGAFASNIKEFDTLRNFLSSATLTMLVDLPFTLLFLFVIYLLAGKIMLVPLIAGVLIIIYGIIIARPLKKHIDETSKLGSWKNGVLIECLSALETIKSFGLNSAMQWRWEEAVGEIAHTNMRSKLLTTSMSTLTNFVVQISNILVIILGVYAIHEKALTMGGLIAVTMLTSRALTPLMQISSLIINYEYAKSSYEILNHIYALPVEREADKRYIARDAITGFIEFRNVSFAYPGSEHKILDDVSFKINAGESVAILGMNGSGKSTILKLIMGFQEPISGTILIDGIDISQIDPAELRDTFNYVPQDIMLLNGTIRENILYADIHASSEDLIRCTQMSGLNYFVDTNPLGFDFPVEERGEGVSGGQKQLIGLSRFFLREHNSVLLIDEPTNPLDTETELKVINSLASFSEGKTMLLVSHKKNLLQLVSRIMIINQGKLTYNDSRDLVLKQLGTQI